MFYPAERELTEEEIAVLDEWRTAQEEWERKNPYSDNIYWYRKDFFKSSSCPWMDGADMVKGKKYLSWSNKVLDTSVRGALQLKYRVILEGTGGSSV